MTSQPSRRALGRTVGDKYRLVRFLAAGGMGAVYEAEHVLVGRHFAVKFLHPDLAKQRDLLSRFQREARVAGTLESENVAATVNFGIADDGAPYIVMEYLAGESLERLLEREGRVPVARAADLVQQACRGVQAAHAAGIVHRDLKPQNLFVCRREDGTDLLKVLDFGVAKLEARDASAATTRTGSVLGTPAYMSPEQARGDKVIDHRADVYSLGAIFYELVAGEKPHPGDSPNAVLHHIATQPAAPLDEVALALPAGLAKTVAGAIDPDPEQRPESAAALCEALDRWSERRVWPAATASPQASSSADASETLLASEHAIPTAPGERAPSVRPEGARGAAEPRAPRSLHLAFGAAIALFAIVLVWVATRSRAPAELVPETVSLPAAAATEGNGEPAATASAVTALPPPVADSALAGGSVGAAAPPAGSITASGPRPTSSEAAGVAAPPVPAGPKAPPPSAGSAHLPHERVAPVRFDPRNPYE